MKKQLIIPGMVVLLLVINFSGCIETKNSQNNIDEGKLIGIWTNTSLAEGNVVTLSYTFLSNYTYIVSINYLENTSTYIGTWKITDNNLIVIIEGRTLTGNYEFSNNDKTITITDTSSGSVTILTKQS
jgi:hypothetical protein